MMAQSVSYSLLTQRRPPDNSSSLRLMKISPSFYGSEILTWDRDSVDGCDTSTLLEGYPVTDQSEASYTLRLDCWNPERSAPEGGAYVTSPWMMG